MGRDARGAREGLCWCCLINLASRASDFLLSNPMEFLKFENRGEKEKSELCAGTGLWRGAGCSFQGFQVQGASVFISCVRQQGAARVLPRLPLRTPDTRARCLLASLSSPTPFPRECFGGIWVEPNQGTFCSSHLLGYFYILWEQMLQLGE